MSAPPTERLYLTADVDPIEGVVRAEPEDFVVEEVPLYEPAGEGEHLYFSLQKRGLGTHEAVRRIASAIGRSPRDIGYAGLKDAHAVTRQTLSLGRPRDDDAARLQALDDPAMQVLWTKRHRNKLKVGHLAGNRFEIRLRGVDEAGFERARAVLDRLTATGVPSYFGQQRFGNRGNTHRLGAALVHRRPEGLLAELLGCPRDDESPVCREARTRYEADDLAGALELFPRSFIAERAALEMLVRREGRPAAAVKAIPKKMRALYVSAYQSELFNRYLNDALRRTRAGDDGGPRLDRLAAGEVAYLHRNGAAFVVDDAAECGPRLEAFEISPSGPVFGSKLLRPSEGTAARAVEDGLLDEEGLGLQDFARLPGLDFRGERRALRFGLGEPEVARVGGDIVLKFTLPKGCYATAVLEELMKRPVS